MITQKHPVRNYRAISQEPEFRGITHTHNAHNSYTPGFKRGEFRLLIIGPVFRRITSHTHSNNKTPEKEREKERETTRQK